MVQRGHRRHTGPCDGPRSTLMCRDIALMEDHGPCIIRESLLNHLITYLVSRYFRSTYMENDSSVEGYLTEVYEVLYLLQI